MKEIVNDGFAKVVKPYMDAQDKKSREIIAPVEVSPAEAAHSAGEQIIFNGILYDVIAPIAIDDALSTSGAGANISAADNIEAQIKATKSQIQTAAAQAAAQNKNTQEMIAPVEEDETDASRAYAIGDQLILDGVLYNVIDAIAQHGIITSEGAGANIEEADNVTDQFSSLNGAFTKQSTVNGAVNELDHTGVTDTSGTVKFTVNEDKSITVSADSYPVTLDSTITFFFFGTNSAAVSNIFKGKKFTGCPSGNTSDKVKIAIQGFSSSTPSSGTDYSDTGNGAIIGNENYIRMYIRLGSGYQLTSALTFKPMISLPELGLSYADYVPYAKTNKELTDDVANIDTQMSYINPVQNTMRIYMTSDAVPTWGSLTNQDAKDYAQAMYDLYKKIDGQPLARFGRLSIYWLKKSDGTSLGSTNGTVEITNAGPTYDQCLADNSKMRMRISLQEYGQCTTTDFALWGSTFTYLRQTVDGSGSLVSYHQKETVGTISTFVG